MLAVRNRAIDGRGLSPPRSAALPAATGLSPPILSPACLAHSEMGHVPTWAAVTCNHAKTNPDRKLTLDQRVDLSDRKLEGHLNRRPTMNESNPPSSPRPRRAAWNRGKMPGPIGAVTDQA